MAETDRIAGLKGSVGIKAPCRMRSAVNIALSGVQPLNGVIGLAGDRVLVDTQVTASQNGIYAMATGAWVREPDWDGAYDVLRGTLIYVLEGEGQFGKFYHLNTDSVVVGTTAAAFVVGPTP